MKKYIEYAANVYGVYLKYFSKDDIYVYSIDEVFIDCSAYMKLYKRNAIELANMVIKDVFNTYGLTAAAGIGTNLYLAKIALDITAKHSPNNIGWLDEEKYVTEVTPLIKSFFPN
jgi:DNA polymerase V